MNKKNNTKKVEAPKAEAPKIVKCEYHTATARARETKETIKHIVNGWIIRVKWEREGKIGEWEHAAEDSALTYKGYGKLFRDKDEANKARLELCAEVGINWDGRDKEYAAVCETLKARANERANKRKENAQKTVNAGEFAFMKRGRELRKDAWTRVVALANG